jgi:hypothetical protein
MVRWPISVPLTKSKVVHINHLAQSFRIIGDAASLSVGLVIVMAATDLAVELVDRVD